MVQVEYYLINNTKVIRYSLKQAKKYVLSYISILEQEKGKRFSNNELEEIYICGINHGITVTFTGVYRNGKGEIKFKRTFRYT